MNWFFTAPRRAYLLVCVASIAMLGFALYLQHSGGLAPCPMCIVQRYALSGVAIFSALASLLESRAARATLGLLALLAALGGAFTAAQQSWLQWHPPEVASCGRDFYGMIETFPLQRALPMIFRGSGDCAKIDWTFLGLSIANWSFLAFSVLTLLLIALLFARRPVRYRGNLSNAA